MRAPCPSIPALHQDTLQKKDSDTGKHITEGEISSELQAKFYQGGIDPKILQGDMAIIQNQYMT